MDPKETQKTPFKIHLVSSTDSPEFAHLTQSLTRSSLVALDAEWKPTTRSDNQNSASFPAVCLLQIACRLGGDSDESHDSVVFLIDLLSIPLESISVSLSNVLVSPEILKLGFRFKQDLVYLSSTFSSHGFDNGFDRIEPFLDITSIYNHIQHNQYGKRVSKQIKSLATICKEVLGISLSKELQCSDWSQRPLTEAQMQYAAMDAQCLLEIFNVFQAKVIKEWDLIHDLAKSNSLVAGKGLIETIEKEDICDKISRVNLYNASDTIQRSYCSNISLKIASKSLSKIVQRYGEKLLLQETDKKPKTSKKKPKRRSSTSSISKENESETFEDWQSHVSWDFALDGNGSPKFLCDVMVEGLAKHLRCVGIDAAVPCSKKPDPRDLINQAHRENRVLLTRDAKLLRYQYAIKNQIYRVKNLLKNEQLLEVIETFQLKISEGQLMSRCTKCNGKFIQKPLSTEEAVEAAKGFQRIPNCLFNQNLEFWQCMDCNQLYWEGTQYKNAVQKFIDVCKLND